MRWGVVDFSLSGYDHSLLLHLKTWTTLHTHTHTHTLIQSSSPSLYKKLVDLSCCTLLFNKKIDKLYLSDFFITCHAKCVANPIECSRDCDLPTLSIYHCAWNRRHRKLVASVKNWPKYNLIQRVATFDRQVKTKFCTRFNCPKC